MHTTYGVRGHSSNQTDAESPSKTYSYPCREIAAANKMAPTVIWERLVVMHSNVRSQPRALAMKVEEARQWRARRPGLRC